MRLVKVLLAELLVVGALLLGVVTVAIMAGARASRLLGRFGRGRVQSPQSPRHARSRSLAGEDVIDITVREASADGPKS
jgi:hypothetical protein